MTKHWIDVRGECAYCGGDEKCYLCAGTGHDEELPGGECEDCGGDGVCPECLNGKEHWLLFGKDGGVRGSKLNHKEVARFILNGTLPDWWMTYHGVQE